MTSDLSIFAARLRDFIGICMAEPLYTAPNPETAWQSHCDAEYNGMALVLFALQFNHNRAYRKFCAARGLTPADVHHWKQIHAMPTAAFKEFEMTSLAPDERTAVFHSSGTTEQKPSRHFHSAESLALYEASLWPWFNFQFPISNFQLAVLTPPPALAQRSSLIQMFETVRQKLGAPERAFLGRADAGGAWTLDFDPALVALDSKAGTRKPKLVLGTAFSFVHLLDFLAAKNLRLTLPPGSRVMETGGYKNRSRSLPKAELHALITERLGVPPPHIICEYGMSELSSQAYDFLGQETENRGQNSGRVFRFPPWARAQIISPETGREVGDGETGLIRVFDLANAFSVAAIHTEDLAVRHGDGFELIGRAQPAEPRGCSLMTA